MHYRLRDDSAPVRVGADAGFQRGRRERSDANGELLEEQEPREQQRRRQRSLRRRGEGVSFRRQTPSRRLTNVRRSGDAFAGFAGEARGAYRHLDF